MKLPTVQESFGILYEVDNIDIAIYHQRIKEVKEEYYPYIPFRWDKEYFLHSNKESRGSSVYFFFKKLHEVLGNKKFPRFLDIGAGSGRVIKLASSHGFNSVGIEVIPEVVNLGRKYHELSEKELLIGDAFSFSGDFFGQFDIIYTYMPIRNTTLMRKLREHIVSNTKIGTVFVEMLPDYIIEKKGMPPIQYPIQWPYITRKTKNGEDFVKWEEESNVQ